ncbi:endonuclease domain-containing protein [Bordetella bronchiseptica]|uniref:endonuclease domain-containing protein n=1 Tax=Bordetella bronchiseptica TaxID=518 RepID=UPI001F36D23A|nr:endonuclease domain-containing protein [Bordetella bronchiseptica]
MIRLKKWGAPVAKRASKRSTPQGPSVLEERFARDLRAVRVVPPVREYRFAAPRQWRFDFAWPHARVAVEIEGGVWTGGRHTRGAGFVADTEKYNAAAIAGWRVLRFTEKAVRDGTAIAAIEQLLGAPPYNPGII